MSDSVLELDWQKLVDAQKLHGSGSLFNVITCDPPWQLSSANPTRGVAIAYDQLGDSAIKDVPFDML